MRLIWIPVLLLVASLSWAGLSLSAHFKANAELTRLKALGGDLQGLRDRNANLKNLQGLQAEMDRLRKDNSGFDEAKKDNDAFRAEKAATEKHVREVLSVRIEAQREKLETENKQLVERTKSVQAAAIAGSQPACFQMLRQILGAKEQWALENRKVATDIPTTQELAVYLRGVQLKCPGGGIHSIGYVSELPSCSVHGGLTAAR